MKKSIHTFIFEPSEIILQGLISILSHAEHEFIISVVNSLEEINLSSVDKKIDLLIINPLLLINSEKEIRKIKKKVPQVIIAGVNLSIVDNKTLSHVDVIINAYSSSSEIINALKKHLEQKEGNNETVDDDDSLSEREIEVLLQLINGLTNKEIAQALNISIHTVISHRKNIMSKTGIRSQSGLALYAVSKSLVSLDDFDL